MRLAIVLIVILFLWLINKSRVEHFATSHGTVTQLLAKGRHDQYLTGNRPMTQDTYPPKGMEQNDYPFEALIAKSTKTSKLPHYYVGWYPGVADNRRRFQYSHISRWED